MNPDHTNDTKSISVYPKTMCQNIIIAATLNTKQKLESIIYSGAKNYHNHPITKNIFPLEDLSCTEVM